MAANVSLLAALFAGIVSFLSPCVLPLVPPYLAYLAGASLEGADARAARTRSVLTALLFVAGFSTVFIALGASASVLGGLLRAWSYHLSIVAGIAIIVMGLHFLGLFRLGFMQQTRQASVEKPAALWGAYAMGLAFAFGWTPCIGPILAAILAVAASEATVARGAGLLAVYSLGLGIPFVIAALFVGPFAAFMTRFRAQMHRVEQVMGGFLVLTGIAFLTGSITTFSFWLLEAFPALGRIG